MYRLLIFLLCFSFGVLNAQDTLGFASTENHPDVVDEKRDEQKISVYPNPAVDHFKIKLSDLMGGIYQIKLFNLNGELVQTLFLGTLDSGETTLEFSAAELKLRSGIYLLSWRGKGFLHKTKKLIIQ